MQCKNIIFLPNELSLKSIKTLQTFDLNKDFETIYFICLII